MSRIYADFLPLNADDTSKNYGLLPPVVKVLISIPNDIEFLVSRSDKEEVTEIRKALQLVLNDYIRKAREIVRHYRTDRNAGNINFVARNTWLGSGTNLTYVSNYGVEYITLRIHGDEAREIIKKLKEEEEKLCLLVLYDNNRVLAIPMEGIAGGNFRTVYRAKLKSSWAQATSRAASERQTFGAWAPLNTLQLKFGKKTHIACIGGVSFETGRAEYIESSSYMVNVAKGLLGGVKLTRPELSITTGIRVEYAGTVMFTGTEDRIYTPVETLSVSGDGSLTVIEQRELLSGYGTEYVGTEAMVSKTGDRYRVEAGGGFVWWAIPAQFTSAQDAIISAVTDNVLYKTFGPGDGDVDYVTVTDDGTRYSGASPVPVPVFSQRNGLDEVDLEFESVSTYYKRSPSPKPPDDGVGWSGFGLTFDFLDTEIYGTGTRDFAPFPNVPSLGKTLDKMYALARNDAPTITTTLYTPYEVISFNTAPYIKPGVEPKLHVSNGKHYIQGYRVSNGSTWAGNQKFFLDGANITAALEAVTGVRSNNINSMLMDIKLSDIKKLK